MLDSVRNFIFKHYIFCLYFLVVTALLFGLYSESGHENVIKLMLFYVLPLIISYVLFFRFFDAKRQIMHNKLQEKIKVKIDFNDLNVGLIFLVFISVVFCMYPLFFGYFPGFYSINEYDYYKLYELRKSVTSDVPSWFNYLTSFTIKAVLPFAILYVYVKKKLKLFIAFLFIALLFGINCMQKSYFMIFYLPLIIYMVINKKWLHSVMLVVVVLFSVYSMVVITNPEIKYSYYCSINKLLGIENKQNNEKVEKVLKESGSFTELKENNVTNSNEMVVNSLIDRTLLLPGKMVGKWLKIVPKSKPYLYFSGYRLTALLTRQKFHEYSVELYPLIFSNYYKQGYTGTVNVASFINNYVCFGWWGVFFGAIILSFILACISFFFENNFGLSMAINTMPVLMLSSTSFSILLFSGGWGLFMLLAVLFLMKERSFQVKHS